MDCSAGQNTSRSLIYSSGDGGLLFFVRLWFAVLCQLFIRWYSHFFRLSRGGTLPWAVLEKPWNIERALSWSSQRPSEVFVGIRCWQKLFIVRWEPHNKWTTSVYLTLIEAYIFWLEVGNVILLVETWAVIYVLHQMKQKILCRCTVENNNRDIGSEMEGTRRGSVKCKNLWGNLTISCVPSTLKIGKSSLSGISVKNFLKVWTYRKKKVTKPWHVIMSSYFDFEYE